MVQGLTHARVQVLTSDLTTSICRRTKHTEAAMSVQGLIDAHVHLMSGGQALSWLDLSLVTSREQFVAAVQGAAGTCSLRKTLHSVAILPVMLTKTVSRPITQIMRGPRVT